MATDDTIGSAPPDPGGDEPGSANNRESLKEEIKKAAKEIAELGGWASFKNGTWLPKLIQRSFRAYYTNANAEYLRAKYPRLNAEALAKKLTSIAARNAALLGVVIGAAISADEIVAVATGGGGGWGLPANIAIAVVCGAAEAIVLVRMHLHLIANLAKIYGVPLDPDDPEDILTILAFAVGGAAAEAAGKFGMKVGSRVTKAAIRATIRKEVLEALKSIARKIGIKILQRTIIKYAVPVVSMGIGGAWNYTATRAVGKLARDHFAARAAELGN
jgi:uncharacterized protein (DUF697 family)